MVAYAANEHPYQEVIGNGAAVLRVAKYVARANDGPKEAAAPSLSHQVLADPTCALVNDIGDATKVCSPLRLPVATIKVGLASGQFIIFVDRLSSKLCGVQNSCRTDEHNAFRPAGSG